MLIPISDQNPTRRFPFLTVGLILANVGMFVYEMFGVGNLNRYFFANAPIPCQLGDRCGEFGAGFIPGRGLVSFLGAIILSTFLHANFVHILGNMLFLWVFGNNIEDHLGRARYLGFYLAGGIVAALAHVIWSLQTGSDPCVQTGPGGGLASIEGACVPAVGASGAVAAVMGAYLLLFPRARVNVLVPIGIFLTLVEMSALGVLGIWFLYQFLIAVQDWAGPSGVAWMAHVGGFVFGLIAIFVLGGRPRREEPQWYARWDRYN